MAVIETIDTTSVVGETIVMFTTNLSPGGGQDTTIRYNSANTSLAVRTRQFQVVGSGDLMVMEIQT